MRLNKYYWAGIGAFVIWGFIPWPLRNLTDFGSGQILYYRVIISLLTLLVIMLGFRRKTLKETIHQYKTSEPKERRRFVGFTLLGTVMLTINWLSYIYVINHIDIQTGSFAYLVCPILASLFGFWLLKEQLNRNQWLAIGLSALSCAMIGVGSLYNLGFSLFIAATYALYMITQRILRSYDKITLLSLQLIISFALIGPFYGQLVGTQDGMPPSDFFIWVGILALFFTVLPLFLNLLALKGLNSGVVGIIMYINPLLNFIVAYIWYDETTTWAQAIAYLIILVSIILYNVKPRRVLV